MKLHLDFPDIAIPKLHWKDRVFGLGSCFDEEIVQRMLQAQMGGAVNPFGTLFHPKSIFQTLQRLQHNTPFQASDFFQDQHTHFSFFTHTKLRFTSQKQLQLELAQKLNQGRAELMQATWVVLTFGTNWGYTHKVHKFWVNNCQKQPSDQFVSAFPDLHDLLEHGKESIGAFLAAYPDKKIVLTVSPVRYVKLGLTENFRSKARLLEMCMALVQAYPNQVYYLPSYEMVTDALRDYRFFDSDLVHVNTLGKQWVWKWISERWFHPELVDYLAHWERIEKQCQHIPLASGGTDLKFQEKLNQRIHTFNQQYGKTVSRDYFETLS